MSDSPSPSPVRALALGRKPASAAQRAAMPQASAQRVLAPAGPLAFPQALGNIGLYANDTWGDCAIVGLANVARLVAQREGFDLGIYTGAVLGAYKRFGFAPPSVDPGVRLSEALLWLAQEGWDYGGQAPLTAPSLVLDHENLGQLRRWSALGGACYLGVKLSLVDRDRVGDVWDLGQGGPEDVPGSWGDHCLIGPCAWDTEGCWLGTWGTWQRATWRWLERALDEAYALVLREFEGLDSAALMAQMAGLDWGARDGE